MTSNSQLAPPEKAAISVGFMRLTDSAPLIMALEGGTFARHGLDVTLVREVSWANLRDKLVVGKLDAAHLLSPLPMMTTLGAGGIRANLLTGLSLSLNGNALTLASALWDQLGLGDASRPAALATARALKGRLEREPGQPLTFATVHAFSTHSFQLRLWLKAGGIDPDRDVRIIVLPPEQMCDSLARGIIDGFCVGEPWNSVAVQQGIGVVAATGHDIWNNAPEKVLGVTEHWHNHHPATHLRLRLALMEACRELAEPARRREAAEVLSDPRYLDLPVRVLVPSLTGEFGFAKNQPPRWLADFLVFHRYQAGFPWRSHAQWLLREGCAMLGKPVGDDVCQALVQRCYRPDLYREAARHLGIASPSRDAKEENRHAAPWEFEPGITLGPDLMIGG
ncbi:MAG TPA: CmpA/NrtA family ABC transporter substrate-binding protein [Porticoccaceae bacterium]|nr:CmpA/NrtA family ABC transporter substrate-binding protein [Porticoccaceae bacterium]